MKKFILIDGNSIFHRAYHSLPPFKTSKGETTNAIYGFMRMLIAVYEKEKPDYLGIAWDRRAPTFRHVEYKEYKATRSAPPDDLYPQLPRLKEVLGTFNIPSLELDGFEADDILGTIAHKAEQEKEVNIFILTGDKDALQLVNDRTQVIMPIVGISNVAVFNKDKVKEKLGVRADQVIDYKALMGDSSDNIPGVAGIGPKQAVDLLTKYDHLENIYLHLEELKGAQREKLEKNKETAYLSKKLVTLILDVPLEFNLDEYKTHDISYEKAEKIFEELEFYTLQRKLNSLKDILKPPSAEQQSLF